MRAADAHDLIRDLMRAEIATSSIVRTVIAFVMSILGAYYTGVGGARARETADNRGSFVRIVGRFANDLLPREEWQRMVEADVGARDSTRCKTRGARPRYQE